MNTYKGLKLVIFLTNVLFSKSSLVNTYKGLKPNINQTLGWIGDSLVNTYKGLKHQWHKLTYLFNNQFGEYL